MRALLAVALLAAGQLAACRGDRHAETESTPAHARTDPEVDVTLSATALDAAGVRVDAARLAPRRATVTVAGTIEFVPSRVARIGPLAGGRVLSLRVQPGERVAAGAVLATLESLDVGRARADHASAQVRYLTAQNELARQQRLLDSGNGTLREVQAAQSARDLAQLEIRAAVERLRAVGASGGGTGGVRGAALALVTPIAGSVLESNARVGQTVSPEDTLFVVGETAEVWAVADVYERDLARVHVGDEARVGVIAFPGRVFTGVVSHLGALVDPVRRTVAVRIALPNADGALRPGMSATARILGAPSGESAAPTDAGASTDASASATPMVVLVPRGAIQAIDGQPFVFVERGAPGNFSLRAIERGADVEGEVEVLRGLAAGERVAVEGTFILKSEYLREQMGKND